MGHSDSTGMHLVAGSAGQPPYDLLVTPESAGWAYSGLRILTLPASGEHLFETGDDELLVLPLAGRCVVACDEWRFELTGRENVFAAVTDFAYLPRDAEVRLLSPTGGRFALPSARARRRLAPRYGPAEKVPVELRGAGNCSRQVNNFCAPDAFPADRLVSVEVFTPAGNWSSYPPHKHDERREASSPGSPEEAELEEIYYFEVAGARGFGYQRVYGHGDRTIDVLAEVRSGDAVLIPFGYHGPSMAAPGYDLYFLNVLAGPGPERTMAFRDDPAHAWIRESWTDQAVDARLPMTRAHDQSP